jgi:hypothetical protein
LSISPDGKIGIGTATPAATLDVVGGLLRVVGNIHPAFPAQGAYFGWNASGGTGETDFINNQGGGPGGFAFINKPSSEDLGTPRQALMFISGAGNVGIGKLSPKDRLNIDGSARMTALSVDGDATVESDATLKKSLTVGGPMKINGKNALEFGAGITKDPSAGQIAYQKHSVDALDIVGAGTEAGQRKISMWAGGGATLHGSLTVSGDVNIGDVKATGGAEALRMLRGIINADGTKYAGGAGFDVKPVAPGRGLYDITFNPPFPSVPAASASVIGGSLNIGNATATSEGGLTTDNALIAHLSADRMRVKTGRSNGVESPYYFSFIVIGPR